MLAGDDSMRTIYICLLLLLMPGVISILFPDLGGDSEIEMRRLQALPSSPQTLRQLYQWPGRFDQFAIDKFPLRSRLIGASGRIFYRMGISISPEVVVGQSGWLFFKTESDVLDESRGAINLSEAQIQLWIDRYLERKEELSQQGIETIFVIAPNKHTIYPQYLKEWHFPVGDTISDQLVGALDRAGVENIVDLRPILSQSALQEQVYRQYDTHWNDRGAYQAYLEIMKSAPAADPVLPAEVSWQPTTQVGDLARLIGVTELEDQIDEAEVLVSRVIERDWENRRQDVDEEWVSRTDLTDAPRAIFFSDSFTLEYLYKFLEQSFQESIFKHHRDFSADIDMRFERDLIERYQPDLVFYILVERSIPHTLVN